MLGLVEKFQLFAALETLRVHIGCIAPFDYTSLNFDVYSLQKVYTKLRPILPNKFSRNVKITGFGIFRRPDSISFRQAEARRPDLSQA